MRLRRTGLLLVLASFALQGSQLWLIRSDPAIFSQSSGAGGDIGDWLRQALISVLGGAGAVALTAGAVLLVAPLLIDALTTSLADRAGDQPEDR